MKRRKTKTRTLFIWNNHRRNDNDDEEEEESGQYVSRGPQLELILRKAVDFSNSLPVPYEILLKIFKYFIDSSDHPIRDLFNLCQVCETWRQIVLSEPILWTRIDFTQLPVTDRNIKTLTKIFEASPTILEHVEEVALGGSMHFKNASNGVFVERLISAPNLKTLTIRALKHQNRISLPSLISKSIVQCKKLRNLSITDSKLLFNNQKWLCDHLVKNGSQLETLNLAMSLSSISNQLFKAIDSTFCPNIRLLDVSTCDSLDTQSFDAVQLARDMPNLEVLRAANVSFKKVLDVPEVKELKKLTELVIPTSMRDVKRDDKLVITLTYGSDRITVLDLRGAAIAPCVLIDMPSYELKELHIDDIYPVQRYLYQRFIKKWAQSLEILSLVKINCPDTLKSCLEALVIERDGAKESKLRELDLSTSDIGSVDLIQYLKVANCLDSINLTACRSLPRGCKCQFTKNPKDACTKSLKLLTDALNMTSSSTGKKRKLRTTS